MCFLLLSVISSSFAKKESPIDILVGRLKIFSFIRLAPPLPGPFAYWDPKKRILLSFFLFLCCDDHCYGLLNLFLLMTKLLLLLLLLSWWVLVVILLLLFFNEGEKNHNFITSFFIEFIKSVQSQYKCFLVGFHSEIGVFGYGIYKSIIMNFSL